MPPAVYKCRRNAVLRRKVNIYFLQAIYFSWKEKQIVISSCTLCSDLKMFKKVFAATIFRGCTSFLLWCQGADAADNNKCVSWTFYGSTTHCRIVKWKMLISKQSLYYLDSLRLLNLISIHSLSECGFEILKRHQAAAHIWGLPRWWKLLLLM